MKRERDVEFKYLQMLSDKYPTISSAASEIINLSSILNLPKGTEHVLSDIHGESEKFFHVLKNGSGTVRKKINDEFGNTLSIRDKKQLATVIYYPEQKMDLIEKTEPDIRDWYKITLNRLIKVCNRAASKYTRAKVRKFLPKDFAYVIEELINEKVEVLDKEAYYNEIIATIIRTGRAREFIVALANLIQCLVIDHLHIVGDIYDRGSGAVAIMDHLMDYHSVDIQWGNHDVVWMGAASGHPACICNVIRNCARYGNLDTLEEDYGINLVPLANFAMKVYADDPCELFKINRKYSGDVERYDLVERCMHKAISILQFKLEGQVILRRPEFHMENRLLLDKINYDKGTITIDGQEYPLKECNFPTINPADPYALSEEEQELMERLVSAFRNCEKLQKHVQFLFKSGSLYLCYNQNLFYHGCVPLNEDGSFKEVNFGETSYSGKALYDYLETCARKGYYLKNNPEEKLYGQDVMWFTWSSENSPVFGKEKMANFERYYIDDSHVQEEHKGHYYYLIEQEAVCDRILREFGLDPKTGHIINGHIPVKSKLGESPIKGNGKLLIIDGGFSKAYEKTTGIAGYTLVYNSYGLRLVTHKPFESMEKTIKEETDIHSDTMIVKEFKQRLRVADTDDGMTMKERIHDLEQLLDAYRRGILRENRGNKID